MAEAALNPIEATLRQVAEDLEREGRKWALVGGLAVSARAEPRTTRDVDLAIAVKDDADAEALVLSLQLRKYRVLMVLEQEAVGRLSAVRLSPPAQGPHGVIVDVLFASSGIEHEIAEAAEPIEIVPALRVPVARTGHLLALKLLARDDRRRPQDWDDMRALLVEASPADLAEAREAIGLIEQRGFHRNKPLSQEFEQFLREQAGG